MIELRCNCYVQSVAVFFVFFYLVVQSMCDFMGAALELNCSVTAVFGLFVCFWVAHDYALIRQRYVSGVFS